MCARSCALCPCVRALASRATRASAGVHSRALPCPCGVAGARAPVETDASRGKIARPSIGFLFWDSWSLNLICSYVINKYNR